MPACGVFPDPARRVHVALAGLVAVAASRLVGATLRGVFAFANGVKGPDAWVEPKPPRLLRLLGAGLPAGVREQPSWHAFFRGTKRSKLVDEGAIIHRVRRTGVPVPEAEATNADALEAEEAAADHRALLRTLSRTASLIAIVLMWAALAALALAFGWVAYSTLGGDVQTALWQQWLVGFSLDAAAQCLRPLLRALHAGAVSLLASCCALNEAVLCRFGRGGLGWVERHVDALSVQGALAIGKRVSWTERAATYLNFTRRVGR